MRKKFLQFFVICALVLPLAGCFFEPKEDPTRFYILKQSSSCSQTYKFSGAIQILNVDVPAYIKRAQITTLDENGTNINVSEFNRWAAPLDVLISGAFANELSACMPKSTVLSNTPFTNENALRICVVVSDCVGSLDGELVFKGHWVEPEKGDKIYPFSAKAKVGASYVSYAEALSKCIADVSNQIAKVISTSNK